MRVHPEVVPYFGSEGDASAFEHFEVGHPVAVELPARISSARFAKGREPQQGPRRVGNDVVQQHKPANLVESVVAVALLPTRRFGPKHVAVVHLKGVERRAVLVDQHGLGVGNGQIGVGFHQPNQGFQQQRVGHVVAFGNPQVGSAGHRRGFVPLRKGTPGILRVGVDGPAGASGGKFRQYSERFVGRGVVEQQHFVVGKALTGNALEALLEVACVPVVGYRHGD